MDTQNTYASYKNYHHHHGMTTPAEEDGQRISYDLMDRKTFDLALQRFEIVVVDAWAEWCTPCKQLSQHYEQIGKSLKSYVDAKRLLLLKDNIENEHSVHRNDVHVIPTFFVYIRGRLAKVFTGVEFNDFEQYLRDALASQRTISSS